MAIKTLTLSDRIQQSCSRKAKVHYLVADVAPSALPQQRRERRLLQTPRNQIDVDDAPLEARKILPSQHRSSHAKSSDVDCITDTYTIINLIEYSRNETSSASLKKLLVYWILQRFNIIVSKLGIMCCCFEMVVNLMHTISHPKIFALLEAQSTLIKTSWRVFVKGSAS